MYVLTGIGIGIGMSWSGVEPENSLSAAQGENVAALDFASFGPRADETLWWGGDGWHRSGCVCTEMYIFRYIDVY